MKQPNIVFIMSDDHASHAMSCYGSRINRTPQIDRIANGGMRFDNCFCTNSICTPSRAVILAGTYNHVNGVTTLSTHMDNRLQTFPKLLRQAGYQTSVFGKWHLGQGPEHCPTGFDDWAVLPGQGDYHDPTFLFKGPDGGERRQLDGYVTDLITDMSIDWLKNRDGDRPFCLLCHHKAPHRSWEPDDKHATMYEDVDIPLPETFHDDYASRPAAEAAAMRVAEHMNSKDLKQPVPEGLAPAAEAHWKYQRYIKDYLRVVASIDDNVGRLLDALDEEGVAEDTIVIYTSDQGFFLGDHGWYDKRFMYEESLRMPFLVRYPRETAPGSVNRDMVLNVDFPATFLEYAGVEARDAFQGRSFRELLNGRRPDDWREIMYYRYWMHGAHHNVQSHYGVRTLRYKLIYYYGLACGQKGAEDRQIVPPYWELFDLEEDPFELRNVYRDSAYAEVVRELKGELRRLQDELGDEPVEEVE